MRPTRRNNMKIRRMLVMSIAAGALVLGGCTTGSDDSGSGRGGSSGSAKVQSGSSNNRIDVITQGAAGDSFWDVDKSGALQAGKDERVDPHYESEPDAG